jgi:hypothetical protein
MRIGIIAISVLAGLPLFAQNQATAGRGVNSYSLEKEAALGERLAAEFRQRSTLVENPAGALHPFFPRLSDGRAQLPKCDELKSDIQRSMMCTSFYVTWRIPAGTGIVHCWRMQIAPTICVPPEV